jgi:hypothetical protein
MKIRVKTNFFGEPEFDLEMPTLRNVLIELSKIMKSSILNPNNWGEPPGDFKVYLNSEEYENLPHGIDTELNDGDKVEVNLVILAGG